jgi:hypothetical protein
VARGDFHGSIRAHVDRGLTVSIVEDGYVAHADDQYLGWLGDEWESREVACETYDGAWVFARDARTRVTATATSRDEAVARYTPAVISGGTIEMGHGERLRLKRQALGVDTLVRRGKRETILSISPGSSAWTVGFEPPARTCEQLPLLTMFAFHVTRVDRGGTGGETGGGPI